MNQEHGFPTDPIREPDSSEALKRLVEIERRLKRARPRPSRLEATAVLRCEPRCQPRRRLYRPLAVVAGSWACGAILGALAMFMLTSHAALDTSPTNETARPEKETPARATRRQNVVVDTGRKVEISRNAAVLALLSDPSGDSAYWSEGPVFRVGMHLVQNTADPSPAERTAYAARKRCGDGEQWRGKTPKPYPDPAPPITRDRLLRNLLSETPGFVL